MRNLKETFTEPLVQTLRKHWKLMTVSIAWTETPLQVHIPSSPLQPGPIYFKTPQKCGILGVMCKAVPQQVNFLTDEAASAEKGANAAISYIHYYFAHHGLGRPMCISTPTNAWDKTETIILCGTWPGEF